MTAVMWPLRRSPVYAAQNSGEKQCALYNTHSAILSVILCIPTDHLQPYRHSKQKVKNAHIRFLKILRLESRCFFKVETQGAMSRHK